jgi:hypothetical protein
MVVRMKKTKTIFVCMSLCLALMHCVLADDVQPMTKQQRLDNTVYLQDLNYSAAVNGSLCVIDNEDKTVKPHYSDNVFYVPLRFVVEKLGGSVYWEDSVKTVILGIDEKRVTLSTRYNIVNVNGKEQMLEHPCFIKNGFTYVAFEDIEQLTGFGSYFYTSYNAGIVYRGIEWIYDRDAEKQALEACEFAVSPFFKLFIN